MSNVELYVTSRDVLVGFQTYKHTGYMLVEKDDAGNITRVQTVDLKGGALSDIAFAYGDFTQYITTLPDGSIIPSKTFVNGNWIDTSPQWAQDNHYKSKLIGDLPNPSEAFNKIQENAQLIDKLREDKFPIDYMPFDQNCNTWSKYVAGLYLNDFNIFDLLNEDMGNNPDEYIGSEDSFPYFPIGEDAYAIKILDSVLKTLEKNNLSLDDVDLQLSRSLFGVKITISSDIFNYGNKLRAYTSSPTSNIKQAILPLFSTAVETRSPLVVDLDGDGVETVSKNNGVYFDHDGNNFAEKSGWAGKDDGLLVRDINNNGQIDDGTELFGNNSVLASGQKASNGFEALKNIANNDNTKQPATVDCVYCFNIVA